MGSFLGQQRPLVIAHRGASAVAPEMTMAAYRQALLDGADGYECDVQLTLDQVPVCFHDTKLDRTSNGFGILGKKEFSELKKLDYGSWFAGSNTQFSEGDWKSLVTLDQLLEFTAAGINAPIVLVETKHRSQNGLKLEAAAIAGISKFELATQDPTKPRAALMSFSIPAIKRARMLAADLYTVLLFDRKVPGIKQITEFLRCNAWGVGVSYLGANPEIVEQARSLGQQIFVWTVDTQAQIELCLKHKVDVIITNHPARTKQIINQLQPN